LELSNWLLGYILPAGQSWPGLHPWPWEATHASFEDEIGVHIVSHKQWLEDMVYPKMEHFE